MYYFYIYDSFTLIILGIHEDPYLVHAINAGLLDCSVGICDQDFYEKNKNYNDISIKRSHTSTNDVELVDLTQFPIVEKKKQLINLRFPVFQLLIKNLKLAEYKNILGFNDNTLQTISNILTDNDRICEYAKVMDISPEFALDELTMLTDSHRIDSFRIFTLSMFWQKKINSCETKHELDLLIRPINRSFWSAGIPHV